MPEIPKLLRHEFASALLVGAGIWLFGILIKFPQGLLTTSHFPRLDDYLKLCANPFARDVNPILAYRISVPFLAWALHLPPMICTVLPILFLITSYAVVFYVVSERTGDKRFALFVVPGLSLTFFGVWTNRWLGSPDSFSHLFSALALLSSNPLFSALCCIIGTLNDERWVMSVPFLLYWHGSDHAKADAINWTIVTRTALALALGIMFVLSIRHALSVGWIGPGIAESWYSKMRSVPPERLFPYNSSWALFGLNIFMGLAWYWLAVARLVTRQLSSAVPIWGYFLGLFLYMAVVSTGLVEDVSRSIGFFFLAVVAASVYDYDTAASASARIRWRNLLLAASLTPTIYYTGFSGAVFIPFPIDLANHLMHEYGGEDWLQTLKLWFRLR